MVMRFLSGAARRGIHSPFERVLRCYSNSAKHGLFTHRLHMHEQSRHWGQKLNERRSESTSILPRPLRFASFFRRAYTSGVLSPCDSMRCGLIWRPTGAHSSRLIGERPEFVPARKLRSCGGLFSSISSRAFVHEPSHFPVFAPCPSRALTSLSRQRGIPASPSQPPLHS